MIRSISARRALAAGVAALALGLAACGGDDDEGGNDTAATDETDAPSDDTVSVDTATDDTMSDDTMSDDTMSDDTMSDDTATDDTVTDDTVTDETDDDGDGDGGDVDTEAYVAAAVDELSFEDDGVGECLARSLVDNIPAEDIAASGLSPEEFVDAESIVAAGIEVSDDMRAAMNADAASCDGLEDELIQSQFSDDPETAACVGEVLTDEIVANVFVTQLTAGQPSEDALAAQTATQACADEG